MERIQARFGQALGLKELVSTLVVVGILLIVGVSIFGQIKASMPSSSSEAANATIENIESTAYSSFELATVSLIVLAAAVIIGILIRAFGA